MHHGVFAFAVVDGTIIPLWAALGARPELPDLSPRSEARRAEEAVEHRAATGVTAASAHPEPSTRHRAATEVTQTVTRTAVEPRAEPSTLWSQTRGGPPDQEPLEHAGLDALLAEVEAEQTRQAEEPQETRPQNLADAARSEVTQTALAAHNKTEVLCNHCGGRLTHGEAKCPHCGGQATHALHSPPPKMAHSMEMTPPRKQQMKRAPMTPRVKHTTAFGAVLHVLKGQPKPQGCCGSEHHVMTLFEGGIQAQSTDTHCCGCCEHVYVKVIPKHTIIGVDVNSKRYCCSNCCKTSKVHFKVKRDPSMQATKGWWHKDETSVYLKIRGIANTHLLFVRSGVWCLLLVDGVGCTLATPSPTQDYVYGILAKSGVGDRAHNLAHMMASGLCDKAEVNLDLGFGVDGGGIGA